MNSPSISGNGSDRRCSHKRVPFYCAMHRVVALRDPGEAVWIEDPGFHQARRVFILAGAKVVPKPLDQEGIVIARSLKENQPKIIHVTPSHQYPLGMTMSFERRTALLDFARSHNAFIFEDDV